MDKESTKAIHVGLSVSAIVVLAFACLLLAGLYWMAKRENDWWRDNIGRRVRALEAGRQRLLKLESKLDNLDRITLPPGAVELHPPHR